MAVDRSNRKKLADILTGDDDNLKSLWDSTDAAAELDGGPIPPGEYRCRIVAGELFQAKSGTPGYKLTFEVANGDHADRRIWRDLWLTPAAMPIAKRDLAKLGITRPEQLERPFPPGVVALVKVALRKADDGAEYNHVRGFEVVAVETPEPDPFAPTDDDADETEEFEL